MEVEHRRLADLISVGPAMVRDFELLGVRSVAQLARRNPERLYRELGRVARRHQDICVLDTFRAAVAQARDPRLPAEQCQWWWWSSQRKAGKKGAAKSATDNAELLQAA
jgi:nucleotidyltransferase/DNA polymerase involved in DNA repair